MSFASANTRCPITKAPSVPLPTPAVDLSAFRNMSNKVIILYGAVDADCFPFVNKAILTLFALSVRTSELFYRPKDTKSAHKITPLFLPPFNQLTVSTHKRISALNRPQKL
ncbi:hypothetical protein AVEN_54120-1 [Araneus ventricosus]|uniref:Uncharacterized protein n=1 Tax=Araneus ventricosus TaxID=182803 RepID=A0A4Y2BW53_ARAVE|nr:hypothetical protein AVEN_54120-1 [Araneus ventricosus]